MSTQNVIVVTGGTRGIGKGLARSLLERGQHVAITGRDAATAAKVAGELQSSATGSARAIGIGCDIAKLDEVRACWDQVRREFGRIDIWVNNAGISHDRQRGGEMRAGDIRSVEETNLLGMMLATQVAMRGMESQPNGGTIYNMEGFGSSGMKTPGMSLYGASKFALTYFNKALLAETRGSRVRICYLSPGIVITDLLKRDMGGAKTPADWERTKRVYNILADRVETVTPWLADGILRNHKTGARVAWLTGAKAGKRFFMSLFRKRQILTDSDFAPDSH